MSHKYFRAQADDMFAQAGGDPANAGPLAAWAENTRLHRDWQRLGVIVAYDGTLIAETVRLNIMVGITAVYVVDLLVELPDPEDVDGVLLDLAVASIRRQLGAPVIHVPAWSTCSGRSRGVVCAGVPRRQTAGA